MVVVVVVLEGKVGGCLEKGGAGEWGRGARIIYVREELRLVRRVTCERFGMMLVGQV